MCFVWNKWMWLHCLCLKMCARQIKVLLSIYIVLACVCFVLPCDTLHYIYEDCEDWRNSLVTTLKKSKWRTKRQKHDNCSHCKTPPKAILNVYTKWKRRYTMLRFCDRKQDSIHFFGVTKMIYNPFSFFAFLCARRLCLNRWKTVFNCFFRSFMSSGRENGTKGEKLYLYTNLLLK